MLTTKWNVALGVQGKRKDTLYACLMQDDVRNKIDVDS